MSQKARIGFTRNFLDKDGNFALPGPGLKFLNEMPNLETEVFPEFLPEVTPEQIQGFDIVISRDLPRWTERSFIGNNQLFSIHRAGAGYDQIDVPALTNAGVMLCITPNAVRRPVAVAIITFILALSTRLIPKHQLSREGRWGEVAKDHGYGLIGKTLGSIGVGNIGHEMFTLAKPFGMKHIAYDPYVTQEAVADVDVKLVDLDTVLAESDFLNISCLLNENTRHLVGEKELSKMRKTAFLINTARGPIVDEAALIKSLKKEWIRGAALDVFEQEPIAPDNPLLTLDNVIMTDHTMANTDEYFAKVWGEIHRQISQVIQGEVPEGLVNREVWDKPEFQAKLKRFQGSL